MFARIAKFISLGLILLAGCGKPNVAKVSIPLPPVEYSGHVSSEYVRDYLTVFGIGSTAPVMLADVDYAAPSKEWLKTFAKSFNQFKLSLGLTIPMEWTAEEFDCDDFTRLAAAYAGLLQHYQAEGNEGILIGEFWYHRDIGDNHAINIILIAIPNDFEMVFFEPQDCSFPVLTPWEVMSGVAKF